MRVAGSPEVLCRLPKGSSVQKPRSWLRSCIANALQPRIAVPYDVFVTKINPTGSAFVYSTYLGGDDQEDEANLTVVC